MTEILLTLILRLKATKLNVHKCMYKTYVQEDGQLGIPDRLKVKRILLQMERIPTAVHPSSAVPCLP